MPDVVAAEMFMLIQRHTHHWTTFCAVAPSNLESVIRRVEEQAAMVSVAPNTRREAPAHRTW